MVVRSTRTMTRGMLKCPPRLCRTDIAVLKSRLYDQHRIEVPLISWNKLKLIRVSIQGYNSQRDVDQLLRALDVLLGKR
jgi:selenocysteine lyase/cysteine desulfurase